MPKENLLYAKKLTAKDWAIRGIVATSAILGGLWYLEENNADSQETLGAEKFSLDMDPAQNPQNTALSLGSREDCARINENNRQDADEDGVDTLEFDVTATEIPDSSKMIAFGATIKFPSQSVKLTDKNLNGILSTAPGYNGFDASESLPDSDGTYVASVADLNVSGASGSGFLFRMTLETKPDAKSGNYQLLLADATHIDRANNSLAPKILESAQIAINEDCNAQAPQPPETQNPTQTPQPAPSTSENADQLPETGGRP